MYYLFVLSVKTTLLYKLNNINTIKKKYKNYKINL